MTDPYFSTEFCVDRLYQEYIKHQKIIVACDFDDTVFDFHKRGYKYDKIINLLKDCQKLKFYICIFTGSPPEQYQNIREYMVNNGINIHSINSNPFPLPFGNHGKMYFNILLDDRAGIAQSYEILSETIKKINET